MTQPSPNDRVRLTNAVPLLWLQCGDMGVVQSVWCGLPGFYDVGFEKLGESFSVRAVIQGDQLEVVKVAPSDGSCRAD